LKFKDLHSQIFNSGERYGSGNWETRRQMNPHVPSSHSDVAFYFLKEITRSTVKWTKERRAEFCKVHNISQNTFYYVLKRLQDSQLVIKKINGVYELNLNYGMEVHSALLFFVMECHRCT